MNNNKTALVPRLRFPEFAINGAINFETGDVIFEPISNKNHNSDLPVLAITQEHGAIPRDQIDYNVSVTDKSLESYKVVEIGDFIISLRSFQGGIEYSLYHGICSPAYIILRKRVPIVDQYYKHYFKTGRFIKDLNKDLEGIRDGKMVSYRQFSAIMLPKPDRKEQQKIADCLSSIDDLIAAEDKKLEALGAHKRGLMQKLFPAEGKTLPEWRFPEFRGSGEWVISPLSEVCENLDSRRIPITEKDRKKGFTPYYGASGIVDYVDGFIFDEVLLCVSEDGANLVARTYPIAFSISGKTWVNNHAHVLKFQNSNTQVMVKNYINSINLEDFLTGMAQPKLNRAKLDIIPIPLPSEKEQQKIADCLSSIDDLIAGQVKKLEALRTHKKGLMQGLFPSIEEVGE
ncbi:restriction modification system DNA specificity domain protein [Desulfofarcimen acetoxidans DSM 771]|uniref:Restriction modification system DNA specificity domain protein n=1 Tax=Desulfofarcimen acetoxidans (strain ATCC 49208 / DSM 771 / KCTC 5769 / VKM B-1644 / 5575) TaxID=485916 RepID=C8W117_DESAS|nr:restriction endonuclease subunit S [Desulfofarcimen acetoxidans]ACV63413.1 restriction modification system DNA specificity domain protein [Desulfofarcimen acetoxidans DSM 771]